MLLIIEICMLVVGIMTLVRGQFNLTAKTVVRGARAYVIGVLMLLTLPIVFGIAFAVGFLLAVNGRADLVQGNQLWFALIDLGVIVVVWAIIFAIGMTQPKQPDPWDIPTDDYRGSDRPWRRRADLDDSDDERGPPALPEDRERVRRRDDDRIR
jgi:hypothetical protein